MIRGIAAFVLFFMSIAGFAGGQGSRAPLTNADVVKMTEAGVGEHTIVLAIRRGPDDFDTSPQALILLKKAGVRAAVMDAMVGSTRSAPSPVEEQAPSGQALMEKALDAFGPRDQLINIHAIRWRGTVVETSDGASTSFGEERIQIYPGRLALSSQRAPDAVDMLVITPDFSYQYSDHLTRAIGTASTEAYRQQIRFDPAQIARHISDYAVVPLGAEKRVDASVDVLKVSLGATDYVWKIDSKTGELLSIQYRMKSGEIVRRDYSDYRQVGGVNLPFKWRTTESIGTIETTVSQYQINPAIDESIFRRPGNLSGDDLSFKVLDSKTLLYAQVMDNSVSATCQLSQAVNTSEVNPLDDINFAKGTTPSNLQMTCNTWDTSIFWPRKLHAALAVASDGNAYIFGCNRGSTKSNCVPLEVGPIIHARRTDSGIAVKGIDAKGREVEITYSILETRALP